MSYIGKSPSVGNFVKLDALTASATASYTMQVGSVNFVPESVNHMLVSLNGVIQAPTTSFTISGSTLTFASALTSADSIDFIMVYGNVLDIGTPSDATITNAKLASDLISGDTDIGGALADADLILVDDGAGGTSRKSALSRMKTYIGGGKILQVVTNAVADTTADTINSGSWEAVGSISVALTPSATSSKINVSASVHYEMGAINQGFCLNIYRDIGGGGYAQIRDINSFRISNSSNTDQQRLGFWSYSTTFSPSTTSAVTFKLYGITGGSAVINLKTLDLTAMEIGA